jgi:hypothetical protein
MKASKLVHGALWSVLVAGCGAPSSSQDLIFVDGRAVASAGDSLLAITRQGDPAILLRERETGAVFARGEPALTSPHHVQELGGRWYVSDAVEGTEWIVLFDSQWEVRDRIRVDSLTAAPHQFAVLPDGRIVLEAAEGRLIALDEDSITTFALFTAAPRSGFLVAAHGGVLHAVPDRDVTLYNENGNIRWRLPWDWQEDVYVSDLAVDAHGRMHMLVGEGRQNQFVCFTFSSTTGEVLRWSVPGPVATFSVDRLGEILPDSVDRWIGR